MFMAPRHGLDELTLQMAIVNHILASFLEIRYFVIQIDNFLLEFATHILFLNP